MSGLKRNSNHLSILEPQTKHFKNLKKYNTMISIPTYPTTQNYNFNTMEFEKLKEQVKNLYDSINKLESKIKIQNKKIKDLENLCEITQDDMSHIVVGMNKIKLPSSNNIIEKETGDKSHMPMITEELSYIS